ncbi:C40 family peptidase [Paenibacillus sp. NEAU-GSW1]|uniref:C40 family peptidase n=1 Tax=Paenibacillus sp. NEAU-GSW1 TaxID=2682486 RepID=UPI0015673C21|nr:C40 family peptidase [Paenibacillus sp. NEAU-GSW1]
MDCSSFVQSVYAKYGISLPRTAIEQSLFGSFVPKNDLRIGDLLFFYVPGKYPFKDIVGHVAIYAGNQTFIHCVAPYKVVITKMSKPYWKKTYLFSKRISALRANRY